MRLIDGDKLNSEMYHEAFETDSPLQKWDSGCWIRYKMFENHLKEAPTVDAVPVKHGRWETDLTEQNDFWGHYCNRCSTYLPYGRDWRPNYCPTCGAKMDLE